MSPSQKDPIIVPLADGITLKFLPIPAGRFRMGQRGGEANEEPVTEVEVPEFWMGETPVTQEQYRVMAEACLAELGSIAGKKGSVIKWYSDSAQCLVNNVNWHEARVVARVLMEKMRDAGILPKEYVLDLPPEALWEYACRAGTETEYWNGDGEAALAEVGWYDENIGDEEHRVGELSANPWGLHDMHGNCGEWCLDFYDDQAYRKRINGWTAAVWSQNDARNDPVGCAWLSPNELILRGGGHRYSEAKNCRSAFRKFMMPGNSFGFRLCVFPDPGDARQGPEAEQEAESASVAKARRDDAAMAELGDASSFAEATEDREQAGKWDDAKLPQRSGDKIF